MLHAARPATRLLGSRASRQVLQHRCVPIRSGASVYFQPKREYANGKRTERTVLPGSQSNELPSDAPVPILVGSSAAADARTPPEVPLEGMPRPPPTPEEVGAVPTTTTTSTPSVSKVEAVPVTPSTSAPRVPEVGAVGPAPSVSTVTTPAAPPPGSASPTELGTTTIASGPPPPSPPLAPPPAPIKKPSRTFRRLMYLIVLLGLSYGGGVYYALNNDNFHDFFTEYIPYGEESVLYFEERDFKRRFPDRARTTQAKMYPQTSGEKKVTVTGKSGITPRVAEEKKTDTSSRGREVKTVTSTKEAPAAVLSTPTGDKPKEVQAAIKKESDKLTGKDTSASSSGAKVVDKKAEPAKPVDVAKTESPIPKASSQTVAEAIAPPAPPVVKSIVQIDPLKIENATNPVVQEMTKLVNDLIQVVNADGASELYRGVMDAAKSGVQKLASDIELYQKADSLAAEEKINQEKEQFDKAALELVKRVRAEQKEQELRWREEYEAERQHLAQSFQDKLKTELELAGKIAEQRLRNDLMQQDIKSKESFTASVRDRIETERGGRLSKLKELSSTLSELESLTGKWNEIVDANLNAQHLLVAAEAVRSALDYADKPMPFLNELVALKEIARDDPVINAAVASINPAAYQKGVPTNGQLIDRFRRVAAEVRKAALLPEDAGVASHAASFVLSKVMFKKNGLAVGSDVESILTRAETLLEEGDLDEAAREMNGLQGWAKVLSKDWLSECRGVLEVRQAVDVIGTQARLRSLMVE